jgi:alpha-glucoside transport system substrate-binding protein
MERTTGYRRAMRVAAGAAAVSLILAACSSDDDDEEATGGGTETTAAETSGQEGGGGAEGADLSGTTVRISGPETGTEADGFEQAFAPFEEETGVTIEYNGSRDFETQIRVAAEGGDLPDIAVFPQPGLLRDIQDAVTPVPQDVLDEFRGDYPETLWELVTVDGQVLGVPNKADLKSLVWYSPATFEANGYEIPETWDDMLALQEQMKADGITPWCIGIESGEATGWPFTDWMEDVMLRLHGPDVYDQWVNHEIPFDDPRVAEAADMVGEIWFGEGNVVGGRQAIAATGFQQAGIPVAEGSCGMHRQANFYASQFVDAGYTLGEEGDVNAFYLPTISDEFGQVTLIAGTYVAALNDKPETLATLRYLATAEYANTRIEAGVGGFLSPNTQHDTSLYPNPLEQTLADILVNADPARFDGSDQMPSEVGAGSFWREGTNFVLGSSDAQTFLSNIESSWPAGG